MLDACHKLTKGKYKIYEHIKWVTSFKYKILVFFAVEAGVIKYGRNYGDNHMNMCTNI